MGFAGERGRAPSFPHLFTFVPTFKALGLEIMKGTRFSGAFILFSFLIA